MSKRKFLQLVNEKYVYGWDDPRMPTISGLRRRGYTPESIRDFCDKVGIAKGRILADLGLLEFCVREHLNKIAQRRMVVFDPLKVVITNYENIGLQKGKVRRWRPISNNEEIVKARIILRMRMRVS